MDEFEYQDLPLEPEHIPEEPETAAEEMPAAEPVQEEAPVEAPVEETPRRRSPYENAPYIMAHQPAGQVPPPEKVKKKKEKKSHPVLAGVFRCVLTAALVAGAVFATSAYWDQRTTLQLQSMRQQIQVLRDELAAAGNHSGGAVSGPSGSGAAGVLTPAQVYTRNQKSVVLIQTEKSTGSGFILSEDGYVVTNFHVVEDGTAITVVLYDGSTHRAEMAGYDANNDIALLKMAGEGFDPVTLGSSDALIVGDQVAAIGNPLGELTSTLTVGYVSAKGRDVSTESATISMLQTDCAINSGNSGGPLFNMKGEVVGITSAKYSGTSSSGASIEGIGFAIPMDDAVSILEDLKEFGYVKSGYLGVSVYSMLPSDAEMFGRPMGCLVNDVTPGSCAEKAGLQKSDIITGLGGYVVEGYTDLARALRMFDGGETTTITVDRNGQELVLSITLDERPRETAPTQPENGNMPNSGDYEEWFKYFFGE